MSEVFATLPSSWSRTRLDRIATVNARIGWKALTAAEYQPDGYAFLATPNIKSRGIDFDNVNYISEFRYLESPELKLRPGDVLLAKDGNTLGIVNIVQELPREATVNGSIAVLRTSVMEPRFLRYVIASSPIQSHIESVKDGMGVPHLFQRDIKRFPLPQPPLEEQRRIADFLDDETSRIDRIVSAKEKASEHINERRVALISQLCLRGLGGEYSLRDSGVEPLGHIPEHWSVTRNKNFMREIVDLSEDGEEELLTVSHLTGVTPRSEKNVFMFKAESMVGYKVCRPDDLVINTLWAWMGALGVSKHEGIVSPAYGVYRFTAQEVVPEYFDLLYRTPEYVCEMTRYSKGVWTSRLRLYPESFLALRAPVPPRAEQAEIVRTVERELQPGTRLQNAIRRSNALLTERRQALITAAVTGQFDVSTASGRNVTEGITA
ncbi:restriction endonuclease subunit S [Streptomyces sp. NPDC004050]